MPEVSQKELREVEEVIQTLGVPTQQDLLRDIKVNFEGPINIDQMIYAWGKNLLA